MISSDLGTGSEISMGGAEPGEHADEGLDVLPADAEVGEDLAVQALGGLDDEITPGRGEFGQRGAAVAGVRHPADQPLRLAPVDGVGDAGRVHLQPGAYA